jgi:N-acetylmuramoyl-L-alanine amidase
MHRSFFRLRACLALVAFVTSLGASLSPTPALAEDSTSTPLGGPITPLVKSQRPIYKANAAPKPAQDGAGTRLAADNRPPAGTPFYPGTVYSDASEKKTAPGQPSAALGPAPYDLGLIKRVQVGSQMVPQTPLRVGNLDIMVPLTDQIPTLGATITKADLRNVPGASDGPNESQYFQINVPNGAPIVLTIGKESAWIGNQEQTLRAAPLVVGNQIYLPIFSIAPLLGAAARLDDAGTLVLTPTIQSVELFPLKDNVAITIKSSAPVPAGLARIVSVKGAPGSSPKVYVDFPGYSMGFDAGNSTIERMVAPGVGDVLRARAGMPSKFPDMTRIVLDLKKPLNGATQSIPDPTLFAMVLLERGEKVSDLAPRTLAAEDPIILQAPMGERILAPSSSSDKSLRGYTIVVDAGHGGHDTGARGRSSIEKSHALDIARRLRNHLQARGANVLMTRDGDYFISLQGRVDFANQRGADLFVSVHINASVNKGSSGTQTFYYTATSQGLAREVHKELAKATGRPSRGISQARFFVVRHTRMPSILTESAFISNPKEEALLKDPNYRERIGRGIAQGVANYAAIYGRAGLRG